MGQIQALLLPEIGPKKQGWEKQYLEDVSIKRVVLEQYDQEHSALQRYLSYLGVDCETGQEIVQESFLKLHEHLLMGGDRTNLRAWLYRVSHNLARNFQSAFRTARTDYFPDLTVTGDVAGSEISPEDQMLEAERMRRFHSAIAELSRPQRECLMLRTQGLKYREIADVLQLSTSTVGENIARGLERLKELI